MRIGGNNSEDLYSTFIEYVLTNKSYVLELKHKNALDSFCYITIQNIWLQRNRVKRSNKGTTSPLYMVSDNYNSIRDYVEEVKASTITEGERSFMKSAKGYLKKYLNSENKELKEGARLLLIYIGGKSRSDISRDEGINYRTVHTLIKQVCNQIKYDMTGKKEITKNDITIKLRSQGCKPEYSGKTKTFYVSSEPTGTIKDEAKKAGFNICKK